MNNLVISNYFRSRRDGQTDGHTDSNE